MGLQIDFSFRQQTYNAKIWFAFKDEPCFLFITLSDTDLIKEFTPEVSIMTDCEVVLPKEDDYPELVGLRTAIFESVKTTPQFILMKAKYCNLNKQRAKLNKLASIT